MMPVRSASSSSTFGFVSHRLLTVIVAFGKAMGAAAATLATAKAALTLATAKEAARMIQNGVGKKRSRVGMRRCRLTMGNRWWWLRMT